jgi:hypothetical protein
VQGLARFRERVPWWFLEAPGWWFRRDSDLLAMVSAVPCGTGWFWRFWCSFGLVPGWFRFSRFQDGFAVGDHHLSLLGAIY